MDTKRKEMLRERLCNDAGERKYALLIGNGFNKYQFTNNGKVKADDCDWSAILDRISEADEVTKLADKKSELVKKRTHIMKTQEIHPAERGIFLFDLMAEYGFTRAQTSKIVKNVFKEFTLPPRKDVFKRCKLLDLIWENGHHILTTNFENNLENYFEFFYGVTLKRHAIEHVIRKKALKQSQPKKRDISYEKGKRFWDPRKFQWDTYYGEKNARSWETLSHDIWHIHGNVVQKAMTSVLFSTEDYFNAISHFRNISSNPLREDWVGSYSWLKLFMEYPLVIVGLNLDAGELLLRHLLMIRRKYRRMKGIDDTASPSYFLYSLQEDSVDGTPKTTVNGTAKTSESKNPFLELMGFESLAFDTFDEMYDLSF